MGLFDILFENVSNPSQALIRPSEVPLALLRPSLALGGNGQSDEQMDRIMDGYAYKFYPLCLIENRPHWGHCPKAVSSVFRTKMRPISMNDIYCIQQTPLNAISFSVNFVGYE